MIDMLATATHEAIQWSSLGLTRGIDLGFFTLRWYSLAYITGIVLAYWHLSKMLKAPGAPMAQRHADDLFFYCTLGVILGGRLGYATFYTGGDTGLPSLWSDPAALLAVWEGGMSFHGGLIGVLIAIAWVSWRGSLSFIRVCDYIAVNVGFGMLLGRIANFVNGELWGRAVMSDVPWAMVFPGDPLGLPRHPSQLYQAGLEGLLVIVIMLPLFWYTRARFRPGMLVGVFTAVIAFGRFVAEFYREPDAQLADFAVRTGLSMGQWLTIPLILAGVGLVIWSLARKPMASGANKPVPAS